MNAMRPRQSMRSGAVWLAVGLPVLGLAPGFAACSSDDGKAGASAGTGNAGAPASGGSAGQGSAGRANGAGGTGGTGGGGGIGSTTGGMPSVGGRGSGAAGGSGGMPAAAGMPASGGASGSGGDVGGSAGTPASGAAGMAAGGSGGAPLGSAMFTVTVKLASEEKASAPGTVGIVTWTVDVTELTSASIEFGLDTTYGMSAPVDLAATDHRTLLLGMKPEKTYHFRVVAHDATSTYQSMDYTVETGPKTTLIPLTVDITDAAKHEGGFIVGSFWQGTANGRVFIADADGDVVWWYEDGPTSIARARMSEDGKNMWMISADNAGQPVQRVSMDTLDAQTYMSAVGSHDITPVGADKMAFIEYGENDCNSIFEITPNGTTSEVWDSEGEVAGSGCHGNALRYSKDEDIYTFSDVSTEVFGVSRGGDVVWKLSEIVPMGNAAWQGVQHGHQLLGDSIIIFANRGAGMNASAAIEYNFETGAELLNFSSGDFSQNLGDVQRLPGGNTLVTFSNDSIIKEIDAQKNVVMEINGGGSRFGYSLWTDTLYGPPPDILQ
jgi:hypothetical protein